MNIYEALGLDVTELNTTFLDIKNDGELRKAKREFLKKHTGVSINAAEYANYIEILSNYTSNPFSKGLLTAKKDRVKKYQIPLIILQKINKNSNDFLLSSIMLRNTTLQVKIDLHDNNEVFIVLESAINKALAQSIFIRLKEENITIERTYINSDFYINSCYDFMNIIKSLKTSTQCIEFLRILFSIDTLNQELNDYFLLACDINLITNKGLDYFMGVFVETDLVKVKAL